MKIITLNTWGGRAGEEKLLNFFDNHKNVDIFCLQEIWSAPYEEYNGSAAGGIPINHDQIMVEGMQKISNLLIEHTGFFRPHFLDNYGLMMFVRKDYNVISEGEIFVYKEKGHIPEGDIGNHARNIQFVTVQIDHKLITIINFHGLWNGKGKTDTEDRIKQSQNIIAFIQSIEGEVVLCGDFNLLPDTESIRIFENTGLINLIKTNEIKSTRTSYYSKQEKYADYIFTSPNLLVKDFKVLPDEVSDHSPLYIEV